MSTIEEEIQQLIFSSYKQKSILNIMYTANWFKASQIKMFKCYNISPEQYNVLRIVRGQKGKAIGINGIQERMIDKNSNASRLVDKLCDKKLIDRKECKNDRRQVEIFITEKGMILLAGMDNVIIAEETKNVNLTEQESTQLNELLNKLRTNN